MNKNKLINILEKIMKNKNLVRKSENLKDLNEVYKMLMENGYNGTEEDLKLEILDFIKLKIVLSDKELNEVSGGVTLKKG